MRALGVTAGIIVAALLGAFPLLYLEAWLIHWGMPAPWFEPPRLLYGFVAYLIPEGGAAGAIGLVLLEQFIILLALFSALYFWRRRVAIRKRVQSAK